MRRTVGFSAILAVAPCLLAAQTATSVPPARIINGFDANRLDGYSIDVLGCVVERASGMPLDQFIRTRITDPLGMKDTFFFIPPDKRQRLVTVYLNDSAGRLQRAADNAKGQGHYVEGPRRNFSG